MNAESTREALVWHRWRETSCWRAARKSSVWRRRIDRIARAYGVDSSDAFVLSSGIFLTAESGKKQEFARVRHIPLSAARLDKVTAVNQLSREIEEGLHMPKEAKAWLARYSADAGQTKMAPGACIRCRKRLLLFSVRRRCGGQHGSVSVGLCSVFLSAVPAAWQNVKDCDEYFRRRACHADCRFSVSGGDRPSSGQGYHRFDYSAGARCQFHERHP